MYSATGEHTNVIQSRTLITRSKTYQKPAKVDKPFTYAHILHEDQSLGQHIKDNVKYLCYAKGLTISYVFRTGYNDYGIDVKPGTLCHFGTKGAKFRSTYIRLVEIALQLVIGYELNPFDLVFKSYYTSKDELPNILPPGQRDTFTNRTTK